MVPKLHVAFVTETASHRAGGVVVPIKYISDFLQTQGQFSSLFARAQGFEQVDAVMWKGVELNLLPSISLLNFRVLKHLKGRILGVAPSLVHLHGLWQHGSVACGSIKAISGLPLVVSPHGMLDPWAMKSSKMKKLVAWHLYQRRSLFRADCVHALNVEEMESVRAVGYRGPIAVLPNGVNASPAAGTVGVVGCDPRRILLFLGRVNHKKGICETIAAWSLIVKHRPEIKSRWRVVIAGWDDGALPEMQKLISSEGLNNDVSYVGPVIGKAKDQLLASASAFILASRSEGLPITVLEAWSFGLPVFMTEECNLTVGFASGAALQIPCDSDGIFSTLAENLLDPKLHLVGSRGKDLVERQYSWNSIAPSYHELYKWLCGCGERPAFVHP